MSNAAKEEVWLREYLIPKLLTNGSLTRAYSPEKSFAIEEISINYISSAEAFMLTTCYKAIIQYTYEGVGNTRNLVVKRTPQLPKEAYANTGFDVLFHNEVYGYEVVIPALENFQGRHVRAPKYYYSHIKEDEAVIVLEDFCAAGWRLTTSRVNLSLEHILLAVRYLGRFHGLGYAFKSRRPDTFHNIVAPLRDSRYEKPPPPVWALCIRTGLQRTMNYARAHSKIPGEFVDKLENLICGDITGYSRKRVQPLEPYATLCHGDFLRNNIAYKYEMLDEDVGGGDYPADVMMFDLQTLQYSSPMLDLTTLLSLSAGRNVRPIHFDEIFSRYCGALADAFNQSAVVPLPEFLKPENMLKEYIKFLPLSLITASSFLAVLYEPDKVSAEELLTKTPSDEEIIHDFSTRGGEAVDLELLALIQELFDHSVRMGVDVLNID